MPVTRRQALAAAVGCGLTTIPTTRADEKLPATREPLKQDPVLSHMPAATRKVFEETFPNHRIIRLVKRGDGEDSVYRGTVFDLSSPTLTSGHDHFGGEFVTTPKLFYLELDAKGKVLEELPRPIEPTRAPKAVVDAYDKWNPKELRRLTTMWSTEIPRGKGRVYHVHILVSQIKSYWATFKEDGTVVRSDPIDVK
jgi:hypothetical protein